MLKMKIRKTQKLETTFTEFWLKIYPRNLASWSVKIKRKQKTAENLESRNSKFLRGKLLALNFKKYPFSFCFALLTGALLAVVSFQFWTYSTSS